MDPKNGAAGSIFDITNEQLNHSIYGKRGILAEKCARGVNQFLEELRVSKAQLRKKNIVQSNKLIYWRKLDEKKRANCSSIDAYGCS